MIFMIAAKLLRKHYIPTDASGEAGRASAMPWNCLNSILECAFIRVRGCVIDERLIGIYTVYF